MGKPDGTPESGHQRMLYENDVKSAVAEVLRKGGCRKIAMARLTQPGVDLRAELPDGRLLWIEAKGQTSSRRGTPNYNHPFTASQREDHFGRATLKCLQYISRGDVVAGLALPREGNEKLVDSVKPVLLRLHISVFLVNPNRRVVTPLGVPWQEGG